MAGCALGRGEVDIRVTEVANPASESIVKITKVTDKRKFYVNPRKPNMPSLKDDDIGNEAIKRRAIARKRGGFGAALGDILLPEGRSVAGVTRDALATALKEQGYRVVTKDEADYGRAVALEADVNEFWSWFNPGFFSVKATHKSVVNLKGPWPLKGEKRAVHGNARISGMAITTAQWKKLFAKGIENLVKETKALLKKSALK
jgi:hypothetical protein